MHDAINRYDIVENGSVTSPYTVWDFYENQGLIFICDRTEAEKLVKILNEISEIYWDFDKKSWAERVLVVNLSCVSTADLIKELKSRGLEYEVKNRVNEQLMKIMDEPGRRENAAHVAKALENLRK